MTRAKTESEFWETFDARLQTMPNGCIEWTGAKSAARWSAFTRAGLRQSGETRRAMTVKLGMVGTMSTRSPLQAARRPTLRAQEQTMDAVERVEKLLEHLSRHGYGDETFINETLEVSAGDLRTLLALARSNSWQPIKTAPKDGTRVLLWIEPTNIAMPFEWKDERWMGDDFPLNMAWPTYWCALPSPPDTGGR